MARAIIIFLLLPLGAVFGQPRDTLFFNNAYYPLTKTKPYYHKSRNLDVTLPSEYKAAGNEYTVHYRCKNPGLYESETDSEGNQFVILALSTDSCRKCEDDNFRIDDFAAELKLDYLIGTTVTPYIQSGRKKYYFNSAQLLQIAGDTLSECTFNWPMEPLRVDFDFSGKPYKPGTVYFLQNLIYRKGDATFVLHHTFIIRRPEKHEKPTQD